MKIKDQCCTLEQAKRLKELGVSQDSYFLVNPKDEILEVWTVEGTEDVFCSAFTVAELGLMLPQTISHAHTQKSSIKISRFNAWTIYYNRHSSGSNVLMTESRNEAEARAAMLIRLLENEWITAEDVNKRLSESKEGEK